MPTFFKVLIAGILMAGYTCGSLAAGSWWDSNWNYRVPLAVNSGDYQRSDRPVEATVNFTSFLSPVDLLSNFDVNSIRVHEVDVDGEILLPGNIPFQFDPATDFNALSNAQGTLVFLLNGNTAVQTNRYFHVYFDVEGGGYTLPTFTSQVDVTDNIDDEGLSSFLISTFNADYYYQKQAGGFSSIIDDDQNDWINHNSTFGSAGTFRGIPNLVPPGDGGFFHPGATSSTSTLVHEGPLKATIKSTTNNDLWEVQWEFFPEFARMTVKLAATNYWFLYEGTPGGSLDINDFVTRPDGTETDYLQAWSGDLPTQEWAYFSDAQVGRSLFLAHHEDDTFVDSYRQLNDQMTVFGFGRENNTSLLQSLNNQFTIGLTDSTDFTNTSSTIESAYKDISVTISPVDQFDNEEPTSPGNLSSQPTSTTVDLTWDAATDNIGVALYRISRDGTEVGIVTGTSFQATGLNPNQTYSFSVIAEDANGNQSAPAAISVATLPGTGDTEAPSIPTGLTEDSATASAVAISWDASTDTQGIVASYRIFRDVTEVGTSATTTFTDTTVQADQTYQYSVSAIDDSNNESNPSAALQVITPATSDTEAPTIPTGLTLNSVSANAVSFSWTPSTDTQGTVVLYHILRDGSEIDTSTVASYTDSTVAADTAYIYNVTAKDNSGNESAISADLTVDTTVPNGLALLAGYPFEEGSGQTVLDLSGNGHNGTLGGNATRNLTGQPGESIEFSGSTSHINLGAMDITTPTMSIALWFIPYDSGTHDARLTSNANGTSASAHYGLVRTTQ
jgi:chitodextrinase